MGAKHSKSKHSKGATLRNLLAPGDAIVAVPPPPPDSNRSLSKGTIHEALVRERPAKHDFDTIYEVIEEIGQGGLCSIFKIRKRDHLIGGSSRARGTSSHRRKYHYLLGGAGGGARLLGNSHSQRSAAFLNNLLPHAHAQPNNSPGRTSHRRSRTHSVEGLIRGGDFPSLPSMGTRENSNTNKNDKNKKEEGDDDDDENDSDEQTHWRASLFFALKVINLKLVKESKIETLKNEVEILKTMDHQNIIKAYETFTDRTTKKLMIVMELCTGGDLYSRLNYSEWQAAIVTRQILSAVAYIHDKNIVHRDLKFTNIMFESKHPQAFIKVIDFGLSKAYSPQNHILTERVGTLHSMSPETMRGDYTSQADLWSIGVVTYMLLNGGIQPFDGKTPKELVANVLTGTYSFESDVWKTISEPGKNFIQSLLVVEPKDRLTARQALAHGWFDHLRQVRRQEKQKRQQQEQQQKNHDLEDPDKEDAKDAYAVGSGVDLDMSNNSKTSSMGHNHNGKENDNNDNNDNHHDSNDSIDIDQAAAMSSTAASTTIDDEFADSYWSGNVDEEFCNRVRNSLARYATFGDFQKLALNVIAKKSTSQDIFELRKVFSAWDTQQRGTLTLDELRNAMGQHSNFTSEEVEAIFRNLDVNRNNVINYTEFLAAALESVGTIEEYRLAECFDQMDCDDSGYISKKNLKSILGDSVDEAYINKLIAEADLNKNGRISYEEFLQVFAKQRKQSIYKVMYDGEDSIKGDFEEHSENILERHGIDTKNSSGLKKSKQSAHNLLMLGQSASHPSKSQSTSSKHHR